MKTTLRKEINFKTEIPLCKQINENQIATIAEAFGSKILDKECAVRRTNQYCFNGAVRNPRTFNAMIFTFDDEIGEKSCQSQVPGGGKYSIFSKNSELTIVNTR